VGIPLDQRDTMILATDGVCDMLPADEAVHYIDPVKDAQEAANKLVESVRTRWPTIGNTDDITAVVVKST